MTRLLDQVLEAIKIRYKLLLLVLTPFLGFASLAVIEVNTQHNEWRETEQVADNNQWSNQLLELMVGLGEENGYIQAYQYTGDEEFLRRYENNKRVLDPIIMQLHETRKFDRDSLPEIKDQRVALIRKMEQHATVRTAFESGVSQINYSLYYDGLIDHILRIQRVIAMDNRDPGFLNQYNALDALWTMIELASAERALIFQIIDKVRVEPKKYRQISAIFKQQNDALRRLNHLADLGGNESLLEVLSPVGPNQEIEFIRNKVKRKVGNDER
ncbi:MAG: nitrate- and nitrite sensing domain-containing protein, partial [Pseudomonadota bacterium]